MYDYISVTTVYVLSKQAFKLLSLIARQQLALLCGAPETYICKVFVCTDSGIISTVSVSDTPSPIKMNTVHMNRPQYIEMGVLPRALESRDGAVQTALFSGKLFLYRYNLFIPELN